MPATVPRGGWNEGLPAAEAAGGEPPSALRQWSSPHRWGGQHEPAAAQGRPPHSHGRLEAAEPLDQT